MAFAMLLLAAIVAGMAPSVGSASNAVPANPFTASGSRTWDVSRETSDVIGEAGTLYRFNVKTETEVAYDADQLAREVVAILADERSWAGRLDVRFQLVAGGADSGLAADPGVEFTLYLATPNTVDALCAPLPTRGRLSCRNGNRVVENFHRWMRGPDVFHNLFAGELETYRQYLINHEIGHRIGRGHENISTCRPDMYAPVMMQQTFGLRGCAINGWPVWDRLTVGTGPVPAPPEPAPTGVCDPTQVFPWTAADRPLDDAITRLYEAGFARPPDPEGLAHWTSVVANGTSVSAVAATFLGTPEGREQFDGLDDAAFVAEVYRNVLGREPDEDGRRFWEGQMDGGLSRSSLLQQLADSGENVARTGTSRPQTSEEAWLGRIYGVVFDRLPDCEGARFWLWASGNTSQRQIIGQFLDSPEFSDRYGDLDDAAFIAELYKGVLGREADAQGLAFWREELESDRQDRLGIVGAWLATPELILRTGSMP